MAAPVSSAALATAPATAAAPAAPAAAGAAPLSGTNAASIALLAVSPIDGRYEASTAPLRALFSEFALFKYRVRVEVEYFAALTTVPEVRQLRDVTPAQLDTLRALTSGDAFTIEDALTIKETERKTNHDVKAVEYYLKSRMESAGLGPRLEFVHFGLTSQDINNTSVPMMLRDAVRGVYLPALAKLTALLREKTVKGGAWDLPMLARTHGQPATPTNLAKEYKVWIERLDAQVAQLEAVPFTGKFGGATGGLNAHRAAYPTVDWPTFADRFVTQYLGLDKRQHFTTQIEHYDNIAALCDAMRRVHTILLDLARDTWQYVSLDYFHQQVKAGEVGSSAMPHKVNPIDFENAEGNLGVANALLEFFASKLPVSRLQRDLTDSTVLRNLGVPFGHALVAFGSLERGLRKLLVNAPVISRDLTANWVIVAEAIQTVLRSEGYPQPYEQLRDLTRGNDRITQAAMEDFIDKLEVTPEMKVRLKSFTPQSFAGFTD
jgi:adenylosuccinate lyase